MLDLHASGHLKGLTVSLLRLAGGSGWCSIHILGCGYKGSEYRALLGFRSGKLLKAGGEYVEQHQIMLLWMNFGVSKTKESPINRALRKVEKAQEEAKNN